MWGGVEVHCTLCFGYIHCIYTCVCVCVCDVWCVWLECVLGVCVCNLTLKMTTAQ